MIDWIVDLVKKINAVVWGPPMIAIILSAGIYFSIRTKLFHIFKLKLILKETIGKLFKGNGVVKSSDKKAISQFQALSTALAATIGTGSIAGVATAITIGGSGSIFWMWVSSFFGMMTAFAENVLGIKYRKRNKVGEWVGGAMYYIEYGLKSKWLAVLFSVFCIGASIGMGNLTQINSISESVKMSADIPQILTGIVVAVFIGIIVLGGIKRVGKVTEIMVPFVSIFFIIGVSIILIVNYKHIITVFKDIVQSAFGLKAGMGGIAGLYVRKAISMGFKRGVFSNEAGLGSAVTVHAAADVKEPVVQGMWGIIEVFIDTIVVCSLTAFAILVGRVADPVGEINFLDGAPLVITAFKNTLGNIGGVMVTVSIILFALATMIGWSYIGEKSFEYIFGQKHVKIYRIIFILIIIPGSISSLELVWEISDMFNGLMAIPNMVALFLLSGEVISETKSYLKKYDKK